MARDMVGKAVGGYRLGEVLGKGRSSTVYEAEHATSGRKTVIKVFSADFSKDKNAAARLVAEVHKATATKHLHLADVEDVGMVEHKGKRHLFVVIERLRGETLAQRLSRQKTLPLHQALQIATDVGAALQALKRQGLTHGALSTGSVFLAKVDPVDPSSFDEPEDVVKLLDLGLYAIRSADPGTLAVTGAGEEDVSEPTEPDDIRALAGLVRVMLGGIDSSQPLLSLRQKNRDVPPHVDVAIGRAFGRFGKDATFSSPSAFCAALLGQDGSIPSYGVWSADGSLPAPTGKGGLSMGWVVLALALVGAGVGLWRHFSQPPVVGVADLSRPADLQGGADLRSGPVVTPVGDLAGAADLASKDLAQAPRDLGAAPDLAPAVVRPQRPKRVGPPVPPLRGPKDYDPAYKPPVEEPVAPKPEAKPEVKPEIKTEPLPKAEAIPVESVAPKPKRPKRTGPPIPPLRM